MTRCQRIFSGYKCKSDVNNEEYNILLTGIPMHLCLVWQGLHSPKYKMHACLPACIYYTHMCVHIHNCSDMILCATCHKRPPVLSDCFCWAGGVVAENRFLISLEMWILCAYLSIYIERITFFCNNTKQFLVVACILSHTSMLCLSSCCHCTRSTLSLGLFSLLTSVKRRWGRTALCPASPLYIGREVVSVTANQTQRCQLYSRSHALCHFIRGDVYCQKNPGPSEILFHIFQLHFRYSNLFEIINTCNMHGADIRWLIQHTRNTKSSK